MADTPPTSLTPLPGPPHDGPRLPTEPCGACGRDLEPLRAGGVLAFEDGLRFLCDETCVTDYRGGKRHKRRPTPPSSQDPLLPPDALANARAQLQRGSSPPSGPGAPPPFVGGGMVLLAAVLAPFAATPAAAILSAMASCVAAGIALWAGRPTARDIGWLSWALGPAGVVLAAVAAHGGGGWGLFGAALAAGAVTLRAFFDAEARIPVKRAVDALSLQLPTHVRAPVAADEDPFSMSMRRVAAERIHTGEEVVALEGEVMSVDGVVQAGEATVLPYPGAETTVKRQLGDPVLAGATVLKGALRVLATRVGEHRALVRIAHFAEARPDEASPNVRIGDLVRRWGGGATIALAGAVIAVAETGGLSTPLSAAAVVLLSSPLLALRRASQSPLLAAAAHAGARGIVYQSAAALDRAGRVSVVAMAPHRTLTEGKPEVVEVHMIGDGDADELMAVVAAAQRVAGQRPIPMAIAQFARDRRIPRTEVRRATHVSGRGIAGVTQQGEPLVIGNRRFLLDEGTSVAVADAEAARAEAAGRTPIFVSIGGRIRAVITLQDHLRNGARAAVQRLFDMNLEVVLLTGDQRGPVEQLAGSLDVAHVKAELLPEERGMEVRRLRDAGGKVATIGYPDDDDAVLAEADVAVVLGAAGGSAGERAVALVTEDVRDAAAALWIAQAARDGSLRATRLAATAFAVIAAGAAAGLVVPGIAAVLAAAVDAYGVRAGARLLRRFALRLPAPSVGA